MPSSTWTPARIEVAKKVLATCMTIAEATAELRCSKDSLLQAFGRNGLKAGEFLKKPDPNAHPLTQSRAKAQARAEANRIRALEETLEKYERQIEAWQALEEGAFTIPKIPLLERKGKRQGVPIMALSDLHVDEVVLPDEVAGRNTYNLKIAEVSLQRCFDAFAYMIQKDRGIWAIDQAVTWFGGDMGTLYVHNERPSMSPVECMLWLRRQLVAGVDHVLKETGIRSLTIPCSHGNHGRLTKMPQRATGWDNSLESVLYAWLADYYRDEERVKFHITRSAHQYVKILNTQTHFHHGDELKFNGGVGGLAIPLGKRVMKWENVIDSDLHMIGHWHSLLDFGHTVVNGSLKGYDAFAMSIGADYEPAQQAYVMVDEKRGKARGVTGLWARPGL